jgi:hypothetical protein
MMRWLGGGCMGRLYNISCHNCRQVVETNILSQDYFIENYAHFFNLSPHFSDVACIHDLSVFCRSNHHHSVEESKSKCA